MKDRMPEIMVAVMCLIGTILVVGGPLFFEYMASK